MKTRALVMLIIAAFLITGSLAAVLYTSYMLLDVRNVYAEFQVGDKMGLIADTEGLYFGITNAGGASRRSVNLTNTYGAPVVVLIRPEGSIAQFIDTTESVFLEPEESRLVDVAVQVPLGTAKGNYTGSVGFIFKRRL